ncbi:MAG: histidine kinase [Verrucomicrobiota bacterium]
MSWLSGTWSGPLIVAAVGLAFTAVITVALRQVEREFAAEVFRQRASRFWVQVAARLDTLVAQISFAERLALRMNPVAESEWSGWFQQFVHADYGEVLDLAYAPVPRMPSYSVGPDSSDSGERSNLEVQWWASADPGHASGEFKESSLMDLGPGSRDSSVSLHRAITIGKIQASSLLDEDTGFTREAERRRVRLYIPVFSVPSQSYMSTNLVGILCATVDIPTLMNRATAEESGDLKWSCSVLNDNGTWSAVRLATPPAGNASGSSSPELKLRDSRNFFGREVECEVWSDLTTVPAADRARAWAAVLGMSFTGLLSALVWAQGRSRRDQARITVELREANDRLAAVTRERERLTRDLHDGTIQSIYALGFDLQRVRNVVDRDPVEARAELTRALATLNEVVSELRDFIVHEDSGESGAQNVESVLRALVQRVQRNTQAEVVLDLSKEAAGLVAPRQAVEVLQIVREAITNSLRHAFPRQIGVALTRDGSDWRLTIADDGTGFDPRRVNGRIGRGLRNLHERSDELGGTCEIVSAPSAGTAVRVVFPVLTAPHARQPEVETQ